MQFATRRQLIAIATIAPGNKRAQRESLIEHTQTRDNEEYGLAACNYLPLLVHDQR